MMLIVSGGETRYYYHYDGLGSVVALSNNSGGLVEQYRYGVFGEPNTTSSIGNRFMFTGREFDSETGLYYYRARFYNPRIGRFLQTDPVGYADSMNLYQYCLNNPVNCIDPYGLWEIVIGGSVNATGGCGSGSAGAGFYFGYSKSKGFSWGTLQWLGLGAGAGTSASLTLDIGYSDKACSGEDLKGFFAEAGGSGGVLGAGGITHARGFDPQTGKICPTDLTTIHAGAGIGGEAHTTLPYTWVQPNAGLY